MIRGATRRTNETSENELHPEWRFPISEVFQKLSDRSHKSNKANFWFYAGLPMINDVVGAVACYGGTDEPQIFCANNDDYLVFHIVAVSRGYRVELRGLEPDPHTASKNERLCSRLFRCVLQSGHPHS